MVFIHGGRATGKTVMMLIESAQTGIPIMVTGHVRKEILKQQAKAMKLKIPEPVIWKRNRDQGVIGRDKVLIDDLESFLQCVLLRTSGVQCHMASFSTCPFEIGWLGMELQDIENAGSVHIEKISRDIHLYGQWEEKQNAE